MEKGHRDIKEILKEHDRLIVDRGNQYHNKSNLPEKKNAPRTKKQVHTYKKTTYRKMDSNLLAFYPEDDDE